MKPGETYKALIDSIDDGNVENFKVLLDSLDLPTMWLKNVDLLGKLFFKFLNYAVEKNQEDIVKVIMAMFEDSKPYSDELDMFTFLFLQKEIPSSTLKYLVNVFDEYVAAEHYDNLCRVEYSTDDEDDTTFFIAFERIEKYYPCISLEDCTSLKEVAKETPNVKMYALLKQKLKELRCADKPCWIKNYWNGKMNQDEVVNGKIPTETELDLPQSNIIVDVIDYEKMSQELSAQEYDNDVLKKVSPEERVEILRQYLPMSEMNVEAFRVLGPLNAKRYVEPTKKHICHKYGGCRMFTCVEYNILDPYTDEYDMYYDWFTGQCDECSKKIGNRYHAVRIPITNGMWRGCFCSWECIYSHVYLPLNDKDENKDEEEKINNYNSEQERIIQYYQHQMNQYGIQDRIVQEENYRMYGLPLSLYAKYFDVMTPWYTVGDNVDITVTGKDFFDDIVQEEKPTMKPYDASIDKLCLDL
jgi:hypothetical protein